MIFVSKLYDIFWQIVGPLTYTAGGITTVVGAVSWGNPSCLGTTVFARVTNVLPWIQEQMRQAGECGNTKIIICIEKINILGNHLVICYTQLIRVS